MTSTYTSPTTSDTDWCRDKYGDVDSAAFILTNEEIQAEITAQSNLYIAAANCAFKCMTRLGEYKDLAMMFKARGDTLLAEAKRRRFTASSTVGQVRDTATYPDRFKHGDEEPAAWDIEPNDGDYA